MKTILIALGCFVLFAVSQLVAADPAPKTLPVEQRLREIDLTIALHQYEKLQTELSEVRLQIFLSDAEVPTGNEKAVLAERRNASQALRARCQTIEIYTARLREEITRLGGESLPAQAK